MLLFFCVIVISILFFPKKIFAQNNFSSGNTVTLQKNQTINDNYLASGGTVVISGVVNGDVYAAGGSVLINGTVNGDVLAAGGNVSVTGKVAGNIRVVGGQIVISGSVGRNVATVGGSTVIEDPAKVGGSLVSAGGSISVLSPIGQGATFAGNMVTIDTSIGGNVVAGVRDLSISPGSHIAGSLNYWSAAKANVPNGVVGKNITHHQIPSRQNAQRQQKAGAFISGFMLLWEVVGFISAFIIGLLLLWFVPHYMQYVYTEVTTRFWITLGIGVLTVILVPIAVVILFLTIVGIPLAILLLLAFIIFALLIKVLVSYVIGKKLLPDRTVLALFVGLVIYSVISIIPVIGGLWDLLALFVGMGAMVIVEKNLYVQARFKKLL